MNDRGSRRVIACMQCKTAFHSTESIYEFSYEKQTSFHLYLQSERQRREIYFLQFFLRECFIIVSAGVLVVADCDYPQWSILEQRRRELEILDRSDYYKLMMIRQYKATGRKIWPVLECRAATALTTVKTFLDSTDEEYDYVFFDLPGTTATKGFYPLLPAWSGFSSR